MFGVEVVNMGDRYRIGTVETCKVKKSGRRFYVNLDADTVEAFGIQVGDILEVEIKKGHRTEAPGGDYLAATVESPKARARPTPGMVKMPEFLKSLTKSAPRPEISFTDLSLSPAAISPTPTLKVTARCRVRTPRRAPSCCSYGWTRLSSSFEEPKT